MPLNLELRPGERTIINGAILVNGKRRTKVAIQNTAQVLRERDIMPESQANTPTRRLYFTIQLMYLDLAEPDRYRARFDELHRQLHWAFAETPEAVATLERVGSAVDRGDYYAGLAEVRALLKYEDAVLEYARLAGAEDPGTAGDSETEGAAG